MSELQDIIDLLLEKRNSLLEEKSNEIATAIQSINEKFAVRANKIENLLNECGYVDPINQQEQAEPNNDFISQPTEEVITPPTQELEVPSTQFYYSEDLNNGSRVD